MKLTLLALGALLEWAKAEDMIPTQTFFIPMPEKDVFDYTFTAISSNAGGMVNTIIALAISTDNTIVWYDHHEDNYEASGYRDISALQDSTEVWGDGNAANGCAPGTTSCTNANDVLKAGQSIVLENKIDISPTADNGIKYDGGDKVLATYPIAITRGEYPDSPGSLMAGAVEVLDTAAWGTSFVAPVGPDDDTAAEAFEHTAFYVMAKDDNTVLTFKEGNTEIKTETLNAGDSFTQLIAKIGTTLTATNPVQVDLITGDKGSQYELRWFSLVPREDWSNDFFSPVGDTVGELKIYLYNPGDSWLKVTVTTYEKSSRGVSYPKEEVWVGAKSWKFTSIIKTDSGAQLTASKDFLALSLTDTEGSGQIQDWGFPVLPTATLTEKVLVGWGYGCTDNNCQNALAASDSRSVVWISPCEDARVFVDFSNAGTPDKDFTVDRLSSIRISNEDGDHDMSGAVIWAVKPGKAHDSQETVAIAAAWGQNAAYSYSYDYQALDLGTLVPPFVGVRVDEVVDLVVDNDGDGKISPGDIVQYTIQVQNAGNRDYQIGDYNIKNPGLAANLPRQTYVDSTCTFSYNGNEESCDDAKLIGEPGLPSPAILPKRGGVHLYKLRATVAPPEVLDVIDISNQGTLTQVGLGPELPFEAPEIVHFNPSVNIEKTVHDGELDTCSNGEELERGPEGTVVTYCFEVTNTGNSYLDNVVVSDPSIHNMPDITIDKLMAPGDIEFVKFQTTIPNVKTVTDATVTGDPRLVNGNVIPSYSGEPVTDQDPAGVEPVAAVSPSINIEKTVHLASPATCSNGEEMEEAPPGHTITYCFEVKNTGDTPLTGVQVTDPENGMALISIPGTLTPGQMVFVRYDTMIPDALTKTMATATGNPVAEFYDSGPVSDEDDAGVQPIPAVSPSINIEKTVHLGSLATCENGEELEEGPVGQTVTYCFEVKNTGDTPLTNVEVTDQNNKDHNGNGMPAISIGNLTPGQMVFVRYESTIPATFINTRARAKGTPVDDFYTGDEVKDKDRAGTKPLADEVPGINIEKTVHLDSPDTCSNGEEMEEGPEGYTITYCFEVKNTGNTPLTGVQVTDPDNGMASISVPGTLQPGDVEFVRYETNIPNQETVTEATATGNPVAEFYDSGPVSDEDEAGVKPIAPIVPSITIEKTVHKGELEQGCSNGSETQTGYVGDTVTYCIEVKNTGNIPLENVVITDPNGMPDITIDGILAPNQSIFAPKYQTTIPADPLNTDATVRADPVPSNPMFYTGGPVTDSDDAGVEPLPLNPGINIEKTVHLGDIPTCSNGQELEYGYSGTAVTYCYEVKNTGDVPLEVVVTDGPVGTDETLTLAVGGSTFVRKLSSINETLDSPGVAVGTTPNDQDVTDQDPAGVELVADQVCP